ncbi:MAG: hypothetical protein B9S32_10430 [Verrucomicrobia bacterium Tous-C9LFEB]|nr:MAG: hypothetical protein B9S32_10430 [Verrucomicrobia bacterium Tous-C9LFEB]
MMRCLHLSLLAAVLLLLGGCMAYDEIQYNMDFVIGKGYTPPVDKAAAYIPKRILLLPVTGAIDDRYKREFTNTFRAVLNAQENWTVVDWPDGSLGGSKLQILPEEAREMASRLNCDAVLYVRIEDAAIYPPLRQCIRYSLEQTASRAVIASAFQDYDANNQRVANSARSFYQTRLNKHQSPDKSLIILQSNPPFLKYVATASAESLKEALQSPRK